MFGIYTVYVLLPIIPTVTIYKLFPDTTVSIGGLIKGLRLNAGGAFAAYIATVLLGTWLAESAVSVITGYQHSTWTVGADVQLRDSTGKAINDRKNLAQLTIELVPPIFELSDEEDDSDPRHPIFYKHVDVKVPLIANEWPRIKFAVPNYEAVSIDVTHAATKLDQEKNELTLGPVKLVKPEGAYSPSPVALTLEPGHGTEYPGRAPSQ